MQSLDPALKREKHKQQAIEALQVLREHVLAIAFTAVKKHLGQAGLCSEEIGCHPDELSYLGREAMLNRAKWYLKAVQEGDERAYMMMERDRQWMRFSTKDLGLTDEQWNTLYQKTWLKIAKVALGRARAGERHVYVLIMSALKSAQATPEAIESTSEELGQIYRTEQLEQARYVLLALMRGDMIKSRTIKHLLIDAQATYEDLGVTEREYKLIKAMAESCHGLSYELPE